MLPKRPGSKHNQPQSRIEWHRLAVDEIFTRLETGPIGLPCIETQRRLLDVGPNGIEFKRPSVWARFFRQFNNPLVYILIAAAATTGFLTYSGRDMLADTVVIISVVILNAILGFFQEGKAENALRALEQMLVQECKAYRDGELRTVPTRALVPGDVVVLESGDKVPADLRLFSLKDMAADESILTGESVPVEKGTEPIDSPNLSPGDRICIAFSGTFLTRGNATGVVVGTGEATEFGKIAALVKKTHTHLTPLQLKIADFTRVLIIAILLIGVVNFGLGFAVGYSPVYSFLGSVSLVVAAIPEMLPMIVTAILALAATTMAAKNALIRRLPAAETLGCTTVICSDKTGTLTKNEMTVERVFTGGADYAVTGVGYAPHGQLLRGGTIVTTGAIDRSLEETLRAGFLCNNASISEQDGLFHLTGDPTEGALLVSALKLGIDNGWDRLDEIPFDSSRMYMATLHHREGQPGRVIYLKGSPERVLELCRDQLANGGVMPLDPDTLAAKANEMAHRALRVIGLAMKEVPEEHAVLTDADLVDFTFLGLQGMIDPPREEAIEAVSRCKGSGIRTVMITGDHALTARAVAMQLGIVQSLEAPVLTGPELATMDAEALFKAVNSVSVYARVSPEHKVRIAETLQSHGEVVAMTGDGVNDAPALKVADIGVAMGQGGTEVSKEASDMVLTDDNFATIVTAVKEGRHAWNNLEKAILYTLPTNGGQALLVIGAVLLAPWIPLFGARLPLEPVQILWINLFDSVFLTMPLMMESKHHDILDAPPRDARAKIADSLFLRRVILIGLAIAIPGFLIYHHFGAAAVVDGVIVDPLLLTQAQTAAFWAVLLVHFGFVMSARHVHSSAFTFSPFSNRWLLWGIVISVVARLLPTLVPEVAMLFRTAEFPMEWWWVIVPCLLPGFVVLEIDKWIGRTRHEEGF
jgi:Ca2+-transporting ATPase